jgi:hypothetical protein
MLMQRTKACIFKERRQASLNWLRGVLGTLILFLLVDYLTTITLLSKIPYFNDALLYLVPIYYFFTLFLSCRVYGLGLGSLIPTFFQFIGQMAVLILIMGFIGVYGIFMTTDYQENTSYLKKSAPSFFTEDSKLDYPTDAELIHISKRKWGANFSKNIIFRVDDIESFRQQAFAEHDFIETVMDFPDIGNSTLGESFGNILLPPFCMGLSSVTVNPRYFKVTREVAEIKNFCGERYVFYSQIDRHVELGIIMVILPKEKLVWLNSTGWF